MSALSKVIQVISCKVNHLEGELAGKLRKELQKRRSVDI